VLVLAFFLRNRWSVGGAVEEEEVAAVALLEWCPNVPPVAAASGGKDRRGMGLLEATAAAAAGSADATGGSFLRGILFIIILAGGLPSSGFMLNLTVF
jgi:hypothetical protein